MTDACGSELSHDDDLVSDLHKDAVGCRPSQAWMVWWKSLSPADKQTEWDRLCADLEQSEADQRNAEQRAITSWEAHLADLVTTHQIDRTTAIRWSADATNADGDADAYCYEIGLPFSYSPEIQAAIRAA